MLDPTKKKDTHVQGQRRSPSKQDCRRGKIAFRIKPHNLPETLRGLKQTLCTPGPRDPTETEPELSLTGSCRGMGQQWTAAGAESLDAVDLGMA